MVWSTIFYVLTNRMLRSKLTKDGITGTSKEVSSVVGRKIIDFFFNINDYF